MLFGIVCKNNLWEVLGTPLSLIILYLIADQFTLLQHVDCVTKTWCMSHMGYHGDVGCLLSKVWSRYDREPTICNTE